MLGQDKDLGDDPVERLFNASHFDWYLANQGKLHVNNAVDGSAKAIQARSSMESLLPLRQQLVMLLDRINKCPDDLEATELFSEKCQEYAIASSGFLPKKPSQNCQNDLRSFLKTVEGFNSQAAAAHVNDLNCKFERLLKPPKPATSVTAERTQPAAAEDPKPSAFVTAKSMMGANPVVSKPAQRTLGPASSLGVNKRPRVAPGKPNNDLEDIASNYSYYLQKPQQPAAKRKEGPEEPVDERLAGIDPKLVETIKNEIQHRVDHIAWEDIAGLEHAKDTIKEIVIWPMLRPDIFTGLRGPPKGLLLFGPPGTGKTLIGKCIANQANATFFSISASSLTSKWVGEGEKLVRALFAVARCLQPAVIFIDEIDSLLTQRTDGEFEASRRIKTEFLVQFDGASTSSEDRILVIGATNRPQEIDEAARRRLVKRLYIPLPDGPARVQIVKNLLSGQNHSVSETDLTVICDRTDGYSGSDMDNLCREAALGPIRSIKDIMNIDQSAVRPINLGDFEKALTQVRASVSKADLEGYLDWNSQFGSLSYE